MSRPPLMVDGNNTAYLHALAVLTGSMGWAEQAACKTMDPDLFFPERGASTAEAKTACRACPVRAECLEYALDANERFGIWGGTSERERRRLRYKRNQERAA